MNLADIRSHIRTTVDLDTTELTNTYLDVIIREASDNIMSRARVWPWLEQLHSFTTVAFQQTYTIESLTPAGTTISEIASIVDTTPGGYDLEPLEHDFAEEVWRNMFLTSSIPTHWSQWAGTVYLWPKPAGARTFTVRSYRKPKDWISGNEDIDMDSRLHSTIALYSLSRVYAFQEEPTFSSQYMNMFENQVQRVMAEIFRNSTRELVLSRGVRRPSYETWAQSLYRLSFP